jgi:hypothetical protein
VWSLALRKVIICMGFFHDAAPCSFFVHPLRQLEVVTVLFVLHSSVVVFLEVILE